MFQWLKKKPQPTPTQAQTPGSNWVGVNLPPNSLPAQLRAVSRMINLRLAQQKASKRNQAERVEALEGERQQLRMQLIAAQVDVPSTIEGLHDLRERILQQLGARG